jgi:hypothetical protein
MQKFMLMKLKVGHRDKPWMLIIPGKDCRYFKTWGDAWTSITTRIYGEGLPAVADASLFDAKSRARTKLNRMGRDCGQIDEKTFWENNRAEYLRREAYFRSHGLWHKEPSVQAQPI